MRVILDNKNIHKIFIFSALFFGFIMMMITPPFQVPDEGSHFLKAYVMSKGDIIPESIDGVQGYYLSKDMYEEIQNKSQTIFGNRDKNYSYSELIINDRLPVDYGNYEFISFSTVGSNPIAHFVPSIGILCGKVFAKITQNGHASVTYLLYFGRFANLLMYVIIIGIAIKISPVLKKTMLLASLMPMSLFLGASMSYDALMIAITFLATAFIFKLIFDKNYVLSKSNMIILAILAAIIGAIKPNYILVYFLLLFIPKEKFKNKKEFFKVAGIFCLLVICSFVILKIPSLFVNNVNTNNGSMIQNTENYFSQQLVFLKNNPFAFFVAVYNTLFQNMNYYISTTVATFGLIDTYVPNIVSYLYLILILFTAIVEMSHCEYKISISLRISSVLIYLIGILTVFLALYLTWTPKEVGVGSDIVTGVQGRYFIPLIFLPFLCLQNQKLRKNRIVNNIMDCYADYHIFLVYSIIVVCLLFMIIRFWI